LKNEQKGIKKGFQNWVDANKQRNAKTQEKKLKENMELIVNLKLKIKEYDLENQDLLIENDQLRRISMDGINLAQVWKELSHKIKVLCVDLSDRQSVMNNLMYENTSLAENINRKRHHG